MLRYLAHRAVCSPSWAVEVLGKVADGELHLPFLEALGDEFPIPPKRLFTLLTPSAWVDDELTAERQAGHAEYLSSLLRSDYQNAAAFQDFIGRKAINMASEADVEDVLPSVLSGKQAVLPENLFLGGFLSAAHYPEWAMRHILPEGLDYSRFDILFSMSHCWFSHLSYNF